MTYDVRSSNKKLKTNSSMSESRFYLSDAQTTFTRMSFLVASVINHHLWLVVEHFRDRNSKIPGKLRRMHRNDTLIMANTFDDSKVVKKRPSLELTLDDIQSYTIQLKDDLGSLKRAGSFMNNSTEGMMGSTDSFTDSCVGSERSGVKYETLRAGLLKEETSLAAVEFLSTKGIDDSQSNVHDDGGNGWDYPDLEVPSSIGRSRATFVDRSLSPKRKGNRRVTLVPENSTQAMFGDNGQGDSDNPRLRLIPQNSTKAMFGDDKDLDD